MSKLIEKHSHGNVYFMTEVHAKKIVEMEKEIDQLVDERVHHAIKAGLDSSSVEEVVTTQLLAKAKQRLAS